MVIIAWFHVARLLVKPGAPGFLKLLLSGKLVCVYVCVCLSVCLSVRPRLLKTIHMK